MNAKKLMLTSVLALGAIMGYAQTEEVITTYEFNPYWYLQGQIGGQETLGEGSIWDTFSAPTLQIGIGRQFSPLFGGRFSANILGKGKGCLQELKNDEWKTSDKWSFKHWGLNLDGTFDLTNAIGGYNPERKWGVNLLAGIGINFASGNDEAKAVYNKYLNYKPATATTPQYGYDALGNLWKGSKTFVTGRLGVAVDYKVAEDFSIGLELNANCVDDKFNSKKSSNMDWYFNGLVGLKWVFSGPTYTKKVVPVPAPVVKEIIKETVVVHDTIVQQPQTFVESVAVAPAPVESFTRNVFYKINSSVISNQEMAKVKEVADYMKAHPGSEVHIEGYADKGTGTLAINLRLARQRAEAVVNALNKKYGISLDRITSSSMTDHEFQPFEEPALNRVAICVVE